LPEFNSGAAVQACRRQIFCYTLLQIFSRSAMRPVPDSRLFHRLSTIVLTALILGAGVWTVTPVTAVSTTVVISQVYGGGGNAGATLRNDFIELYNRGAVPVSLNGWDDLADDSADDHRAGARALLPRAGSGRRGRDDRFANP
jgi:hypothetical protein